MDNLSLSIVFAFLAMLSWGVGDFLIQRLVNRIGSLESMFWINLIAAIVLFPLAAREIPSIFLPENLLPVLAIAVTDFLFAFSIFQAYSSGKLSVVETVLLAEIPLTIIFGMTFLGERLDLFQFLMIILIMIGVFLISRTGPTVSGNLSGRWEKGLLLSLLAVVFSSLYNYFTTVNARNLSPFAAVWIPWGISLLFLAGYFWKKRGFAKVFTRAATIRPLILWTGLIDTAAWVFYGLAVLDREMSIITAVVSGYAVIATALDIRFNKQVMKGWQYAGATLVLTGAILLSVY